VDNNELLGRSCHRVRFLLATHAPAVLIDRECRLLVRRIARRVGTVTVRDWVDESLDQLVDELTGGSGDS
jgi:hypothetical protein